MRDTKTNHISIQRTDRDRNITIIIIIIIITIITNSPSLCKRCRAEVRRLALFHHHGADRDTSSDGAVIVSSHCNAPMSRECPRDNCAAAVDSH